STPSPTVRNPIRASIVSGGRLMIRRVASASAFKKLPPRTTGFRSSTHVPVHSETFPPMSNTPYGLRSSGQLPTAVQPAIRLPSNCLEDRKAREVALAKDLQ